MRLSDGDKPFLGEIRWPFGRREQQSVIIAGDASRSTSLMKRYGITRSQIDRRNVLVLVLTTIVTYWLIGLVAVVIGRGQLLLF